MKRKGTLTLKCPKCGHKITRCPFCGSRQLVSVEWYSDDLPEADPHSVPVQMWKCQDCGIEFDENLNEEPLDT